VTGVERERPPIWGLAALEIEKELMKYTRNKIDVEIVSDSSATIYMDEEDIAGVIGKGGKNIDLIEKGSAFTLIFVRKEKKRQR